MKYAIEYRITHIGPLITDWILWKWYKTEADRDKAFAALSQKANWFIEYRKV